MGALSWTVPAVGVLAAAFAHGPIGYGLVETEGFTGFPIPFFGLLLAIPFLAVAALFYAIRLRGSVLVIPLSLSIGTLAGLASALGDFTPFWAGWGEHDLSDIGGDTFTWQSWLGYFAALMVIGGFLLGSAVGFLAWLLYRAGRRLFRGVP